MNGASNWRSVVRLICYCLGALAFHALLPIFQIPSGSMEPTLQIGDHLVLERLSPLFGRQIQRGDVLVFYPPPIEMGRGGGQEFSNDVWTFLGRWLMYPALVGDTPFIKRVVGLPGDQIRIEKGKGVFVNGVLLKEPYVADAPDYNLRAMGDIGGTSSAGTAIRPYGADSHAIVVPPGQLFMMGDNRTNSADSHVWGFVDERRVVGRAFTIIWRRL